MLSNFLPVGNILFIYLFIYLFYLFYLFYFLRILNLPGDVGYLTRQLPGYAVNRASLIVSAAPPSYSLNI